VGSPVVICKKQVARSSGFEVRGSSGVSIHSVACQRHCAAPAILFDCHGPSRPPPKEKPQTATSAVCATSFYPFGIYSEKKRLEKLNYRHANPVKRGLADAPDRWPWSSFRFYHLGDDSVLKMDRMP
jgi:hypothetical protein